MRRQPLQPQPRARKRVWILCPANTVTGGPEALHQLGRALLDHGHDARMVYCPERPQGWPAPAAYAQYGVPVAPFFMDAVDEIVVLPEVYAGRTGEITAARRMLWWLSVDNADVRLRARGWRRVARLLGVHQRPAWRDCEHYAQSAYAAAYLRRHGIIAKPLTDYLPDAAFDVPRMRPREDVVVYNPRKGLAFTERIIQRAGPKIRFVPLENLSRAAVAATLAGAKLYIDFGHHPGRDRLPREAAIAGCCILVRRAGSAAYGQDMPIPGEYKRPTGAMDARRVVRQIETILSAYDDRQADFTLYRAWIERQKSNFHREVKEIFQPVGA